MATLYVVAARPFDSPGYDILGVLTGSEGLLAVVTEVTVRILPAPRTARALLIGFSSIRSAGAWRGVNHCGGYYSPLAWKSWIRPRPTRRKIFVVVAIPVRRRPL